MDSQWRRRVRWLSFLCGALGAALLMWGSARAATPSVYVMTISGTINPVVAQYVGRGVAEAESKAAALLVIQLDTPGGLDTAMRDTIQRILNSRVPVAVYVAPAGARAASAGMFIAMAGHVAAMAPNTAIGAAHPVAGGGEELPSTVTDKATNDAAAYARSLATSHGRNADWAEKAVRDSVSLPETEAVAMQVVDLVAPDLKTLLVKLDGREVKLLAESVVIETADADIVPLPMTPIEHLLFTIADPNIAYLLLSLAMTGLFFELSNPGSILPGVIGGVALLLALFSLGMLPVNYGGVLLIVLAFVFFVAELLVTTHGILAAGGVASLTVGSLILMSSADPLFTVDRRLIAAVVIVVSAFFIFIVGAIVRSHRRRPTTGIEGLVGSVGVARTALDPEGVVFVAGERWSAVAVGGDIEAGEGVVVEAMERFKLRVRRQRKE